MSWLPRICAILLLALWLPATSHCALESAGLMPAADACCADDSGAHCVQDSCDEVEDNLIKSDADSVLVKAPVLACLYLLSTTDLSVVAAPECIGACPDGSPPVWLAAWPFEHRTALPARAPSLA